MVAQARQARLGVAATRTSQALLRTKIIFLLTLRSGRGKLPRNSTIPYQRPTKDAPRIDPHRLSLQWSGHVAPQEFVDSIKRCPKCSAPVKQIQLLHASRVARHVGFP
jgi:hypothetical protein